MNPLFLGKEASCVLLCPLRLSASARRLFSRNAALNGKKKAKVQEGSNAASEESSPKEKPVFAYDAAFNSYTVFGPGFSRSVELKQKKKFVEQKKNNSAMRHAHDYNYLEVPLGRLHSYWVQEPAGQAEMAHSAQHYNITLHVFGRRQVLLTVPLSVRFSNGPFVHRGNLLPPKEAAKQPIVSFPSPSSDSFSLWTVLMSTPDGNLFSSKSEVLHWLVCDIPGNDIAKGRTLCEYLPPIPVEGTGCHRYVISLLKQKQPIKEENDYTALGKDLERRTWNTKSFMAEESLTLQGLSFFQAQWDESVGRTFERLEFPEPVYKLEEPLTVNLTAHERAALLKRRAYC